MLYIGNGARLIVAVQMDDPRERRQTIDANEANQIYQLYRRDPVVFMCRQLIVSLILSNGITVEQNKSRHEMTPEFKRMFDLHWIPFTRDLLDAFFMFGFCPWLPVHRTTAVEGKRTKRRKKQPSETLTVPIVPTFGTYDIQCVVDSEYSQRLEFVPRNILPTGVNTVDERVGILVSSDGDPWWRDGSHRSLLATLLPKYRIMQHLFRGTLLADHIRSHPPLITQNAPDKSRINDALTEEPFGDPVDILNDIEEMRYARNDSDMRVLKQKRRLASEANQSGTQDILDPFGGTQGVVLGRKQAFEDNLFHLPDGTQVAPSPNVPPIRNDLMDIERERASIVCGCFGVPQSLLLAGSSHKNGGGASEADIAQLMRTVGAVSTNLTRALTDVYNTIYPEEDVTISLPVVPLATIEHLTSLYSEGIISKETQGCHMLRAAGLPATDLDMASIREAAALRKKQLSSNDEKDKEDKEAANDETESPNSDENENE